MDIQPCPSRAAWNAWLESHAVQTPLAAHGLWGDVLEREGTPVEYFFIEHAGKVLGGFSLITLRGRGVTYGYSARTPIVLPGTDLTAVYQMIAGFLVRRGMIFWRIEPDRLPDVHVLRMVKTPDVQPAVTLVLDLSQTPDQLLAAMHQKTRYNIRLALKKGLEARWEKDPALFWELSTATSNRDGFRLHPRAHYDEVITSNFVEQLTVYADGKPIASAVFTHVGSTYTYLYGASSYEARSLMAPYLVQWSGMLRAKELGAHWYDFYGLAPLAQPVAVMNHMSIDEYAFDAEAKEAGYTRFKLGFGGIVIALPGTWDTILAPLRYRLYSSIRAARRGIGQLARRSAGSYKNLS